MIRLLLNAYLLIIVADSILSYFPDYHREPWAKFIKKMADYTLAPIRKILPSEIPVDISPIIVFIIIQLLPSLW
jgi:YggT family protein